MTVGVDIGYTELKLAKVSQLSEKKHLLLDYRKIPISPGLNLESDAFVKFLSSELSSFCGGVKRLEIWSGISSARVETRCVRIPKLSRKQIPNAVFWTYTKQVPFNQSAEVLDFEILGDVLENGIQKIEVMAYTAPKKEIENYRNTFRQAGFPLTGISIVPFAIQNLLRAGIITTAEKDICNLYIGRDWSRIAIYSNNNLILSRGIKAGMRSMMDAIKGSVAEGSAFSQSKVSGSTGDDPLRPGGTVDLDDLRLKQLFYNFLSGKTRQNGTLEPVGLKSDRVFEMIKPALERLVRQIERTFEHYELKFTNEAISKLFLSGMISENKQIAAYFRHQLELPVSVLDPFPPHSPFVREVTLPTSIQDKEAFVPAVGMGLSSDEITPNFIFTHEDKEKEASINRTNLAVFVVCIAILSILSVWYMWQNYSIGQKREEIAGLKQVSLQVSTPADKNMILQFYSHATENNTRNRLVSKRYTPLAVINEISELTPTNVRIINLYSQFNPDETGEQKVSIDAVIFGSRLNFETNLTSYLFRLKKSPVFDNPVIQKKEFEFFESTEVLRFTAELGIL